MTHGNDFAARSHALWRMRMTQFQKRFGFFWRLVLGCMLLCPMLAMQMTMPQRGVTLAAQCLAARLLVMLGDAVGREIRMNVTVGAETLQLPARIVAYADRWLVPYEKMIACLFWGALAGLALGVFIIWLIQRVMSVQGKETLGDRVLTGTRVVSGSALAGHVGKGAGPAAIAIGPVPIPRGIETRHFAFLGTTGSGKTTALRQMLDRIEARGEAALVYDTSGEFVAHYYNPERGDVILNPFDARCAFWSPFDEISHPADADRIARQLVSETGSRDDDVWLETSRILVANMLRSLWTEGNGTLEALLEALQVKSKEQLKHWLGHTSSARTFADDADRATGSVLFMLAKAANLIQFLRVEGGGAQRFAFRDFIAGLDQHEAPKPWIFVPRKEDYFEAAKPLMACWLECAASAVLGLAPSPDRRIWFVLDELADLPRVENLARLLPEGRKFGAAIVVTFQALGQMRNRYGPNIAETMLACCNTKLILQTVDRETRQWASETIGDCEVEMRVATDTLAIDQEVPRTTIATQRTFRAAVLESELRLAPHQGFLLLPDGLPVARIALTASHIAARGEARQPAFVQGDPRDTLWSRVHDIARKANPDDDDDPGPI